MKVSKLMTAAFLMASLNAYSDCTVFSRELEDLVAKSEAGMQLTKKEKRHIKIYEGLKAKNYELTHGSANDLYINTFEKGFHRNSQVETAGNNSIVLDVVEFPFRVIGSAIDRYSTRTVMIRIVPNGDYKKRIEGSARDTSWSYTSALAAPTMEWLIDDALGQIKDCHQK